MGTGREHVVGRSAGGLHAEAYARRYPDQVASLSRISSAPPFFGRTAGASNEAFPVPLDRERDRSRAQVTGRPAATCAACIGPAAP